MTTPAHEQDDRFTEHDLIPEHAERGTGSPEFERNKARIIAEHPGCWMQTDECTTNLEAHHWACEWSLWDDCDPGKLARVVYNLDPYGYGHSMAGTPIKSVDDLRNLILICELCHRGIGLGVHHLSMPTWIARASRKDGLNLTIEELALRQKPQAGTAQ